MENLTTHSSHKALPNSVKNSRDRRGNVNFRYSPRLVEIRNRAAALADYLMTYEDQVEGGRGLTGQQRTEITATVRGSGLLAMNAPTKWGGGGLGWLEQVVAETQLGRVTNGLYLTVVRPATALFAATPAETGALPAPRQPQCRPGQARRWRPSPRCSSTGPPWNSWPPAGSPACSVRSSPPRTATGARYGCRSHHCCWPTG